MAKYGKLGEVNPGVTPKYFPRRAVSSALSPTGNSSSTKLKIVINRCFPSTNECTVFPLGSTSENRKMAGAGYSRRIVSMKYSRYAMFHTLRRWYGGSRFSSFRWYKSQNQEMV
jgi:hypothetical protein